MRYEMNKELIDTIRLMNEKPIAFNKHYVFLGAGINGALMLSHLIDISNYPDQFIRISSKEWTAETGLTRREQDTAVSKLIKLGFIEKKNFGFPAKSNYRILDKNIHQKLCSIKNKLGVSYESL
jgi:hypothetical protein